MSVAKKLQSGMNDAMRPAVSVIDRLFREDDGQDLIEYALVFSFVALGAIASMKSLTASVIKVFTTVGTTLTTAI